MKMLNNNYVTWNEIQGYTYKQTKCSRQHTRVNHAASQPASQNNHDPHPQSIGKETQPQLHRKQATRNVIIPSYHIPAPADPFIICHAPSSENYQRNS